MRKKEEQEEEKEVEEEEDQEEEEEENKEEEVKKEPPKKDRMDIINEDEQIIGFGEETANDLKKATGKPLKHIWKYLNSGSFQDLTPIQSRTKTKRHHFCVR